MSGGLGGGKPTMSLTKMAITLMTKAMIPNMTKESMKQFDKALSNAIGRGFIQMRKSNSFLGSLLADLFAPKTDYSTKIGTKYERGPLPWDGEAKQALVEVIPTYLAKLNAILGGEEKYYDYEEGKFKTVRQIQAEKEKLINDAAQRAGGEFRDELIKDAKGNKELERQIDTYFREAFDDGREYDLLAFIADPKTLAKKYGITENAAKHIINNYKRYKAKSSTTGAMNKKNELYPKYVINREIERSDLTNRFRNMGGEHSIFVKLEDGSITAIDDGKDKKGKKNNNQGGSGGGAVGGSVGKTTGKTTEAKKNPTDNIFGVDDSFDIGEIEGEIGDFFISGDKIYLVASKWVEDEFTGDGTVGPDGMTSEDSEKVEENEAAEETETVEELTIIM